MIRIGLFYTWTWSAHACVGVWVGGDGSGDGGGGLIIEMSRHLTPMSSSSRGDVLVKVVSWVRNLPVFDKFSSDRIGRAWASRAADREFGSRSNQNIDLSS